MNRLLRVQVTEHRETPKAEFNLSKSRITPEASGRAGENHTEK